MKKTFFYVVMTLATLYSCNHNGTIDELNLINQSKINSVMSMTNLEDQKLAYSTLNEFEKNSLWKNKLEKFKVQNELNSNQNELIKDFLDNIKPDVFTEGDASEYFKVVYIPIYLKKLKKEFSINEIGSMFYSPSNVEIMKAIDEDGDDWCNCNRNSMVSCRWLNTSSCKDVGDKCKTTSSGCGFSWFYSCNGICSVV